jgi:hypothetical protein
MKNRFINRILIMICCISLPLITLAQGPPDPQDTPIDGGLAILLAAGVGYGVKKYRDSRKKPVGEEKEIK